MHRPYPAILSEVRRRLRVPILRVGNRVTSTYGRQNLTVDVFQHAFRPVDIQAATLISEVVLHVNHYQRGRLIVVVSHCRSTLATVAVLSHRLAATLAL